MTTATYSPEQIRLEIKKMIAHVTEREVDEIGDTAHFMDELGVDSLMAMEVMIAVDRKFGVDIPEEQFNQAHNVSESAALVEHWMGVRSSAATA